MLLGVVLYSFSFYHWIKRWKEIGKRKKEKINCLLKWIASFFWFIFPFSLWNLLVFLLLSLCVYVWFLFICYLHNSLNSVGCYLCCIQGEIHSFTWDLRPFIGNIRKIDSLTLFHKRSNYFHLSFCYSHLLFEKFIDFFFPQWKCLCNSLFLLCVTIWLSVLVASILVSTFCWHLQFSSLPRLL